MDVSNIATVKMIQNIIDGTTPPTTALNANNATTAASATKATQDGNGNVIATTYAQQESVTNLESCSTLIHSADGGFSAGTNAGVTGSGAIIGKNADASPSSSGASIGMGSFSNDGAGIGKDAVATGLNAVQLGTGTNANDNTMQFLTFQICDSEGKIPNDRLTNILDLVYPVGSIYINYSSSSSPASTLGGSWVRIYNQFLIGAGDDYTIGSTGGEVVHMLSVNELPSHTHQITRNDTGAVAGFPIIDLQSGEKWGVGPNKTYTGDAGVGPYGYLNYTGDNTPHNNMPPYRAVWMWRRTA